MALIKQWLWDEELRRDKKPWRIEAGEGDEVLVVDELSGKTIAKGTTALLGCINLLVTRANQGHKVYMDETLLPKKKRKYT
jgi:hypothetical protein